jgi:CheY-like chemotaxis protein
VAFLNFERLSILLVEDNSYIRDILENALKMLGFGWVATAKNGQDAIEFLKLTGTKTAQQGMMTVDLVLSDLVMTPINGQLLLRWVRASKDSPNRFLPFMLISGAADRDYVESARDLGVNEFVAKPFSVQSIYQKILAVVMSPRQIVMTHNYFGPDRRRRDLFPPDGKERRVREDKDVTIVYSADRIAKTNMSDVWYFRLPNRLKEKAGGARFKPGEMPDFPEDIIKQAEDQLKRDALDFADWAMSYIANLANVCTEALLKTNNRRQYFDQINLQAHELRGQGGTFGYPLITAFGKMLYEYTQPGCPEDDRALEIVKAHIDSMRAVIRDRVAGDGGQLGKDLMRALKESVNRMQSADVMIK